MESFLTAGNQLFESPLPRERGLFDAIAGKRYFRRWLEQSLEAMQSVAQKDARRSGVNSPLAASVRSSSALTSTSSGGRDGHQANTRVMCDAGEDMGVIGQEAPTGWWDLCTYLNLDT